MQEDPWPISLLLLLFFLLCFSLLWLPLVLLLFLLHQMGFNPCNGIYIWSQPLSLRAHFVDINQLGLSWTSLALCESASFTGIVPRGWSRFTGYIPCGPSPSLCWAVMGFLYGDTLFTMNHLCKVHPFAVHFLHDAPLLRCTHLRKVVHLRHWFPS